MHRSCLLLDLLLCFPLFSRTMATLSASLLFANRHGTVLLGHAVIDATMAWLEPVTKRARGPTHLNVRIVVK
jgi:hypothetical protein